MDLQVKKTEPLTAFEFISFSHTVRVLLLLTLSTWLFITIKKKKKARKVNLPKLQISDIAIFFIEVNTILRNNVAGPRVMLFQMACAYCNIFRKEGILLLFNMMPHVFLYKGETIEPIINNNDAVEKGLEYIFLRRWLKDGLITSTGNKWRHRRKLLTPAFHFRILDEYFTVFNEQAHIFARKIATSTNSQSLDIAYLSYLCTLDIICETAMGIKINALEAKTCAYASALHSSCQAVLERAFQPWMWPDFIYYRTKKGKKYDYCLKIMNEFIHQVVSERKMEKMTEKKSEVACLNNETFKDADYQLEGKSKKKLAFLDLLLDAHFKDHNFTLDDVMEEVHNFMFGKKNMPFQLCLCAQGTDTTSSNVSWTVYLLGLYPDIQRKVHEELDRILGDDITKPITKADIKELKYLECVLKESRRLFPPVPYVSKKLETDTEINGYTVRAGTTCGILIYVLHRNPEVFPNPEVFDPDRFSNPAERHPYAYIPFSAGPRNCIGQKFGLIESTILVATILRYFKVKSLLPLDKLCITYEIVLRSENGLPMAFEPRECFKNHFGGK